MAKLVTFGNSQSVQGLDRTMALIAAIGDGATRRMSQVLNNGADRIVDTLHEVLPINDLDPHPGALRESAHKEDGAHDLSVKVVVDAVDENGEFFAKHVEHGHKTKGGTHVAAKPAFYPTVANEKKRIRAEARSAIRDLAKGE